MGFDYEYEYVFRVLLDFLSLAEMIMHMLIGILCMCVRTLEEGWAMPPDNSVRACFDIARALQLDGGDGISTLPVIDARNCFH